MSSQPDQQWISDQLSRLTEHAEDLRRISPVVNEFRPWAAAKLSMHVAAVDVYTKNICGRFEDPYYIDAMAGAGVWDVKGHDASLVGSPIIAASLAHDPGFEKIFCVEWNGNKAAALEQRLGYIADQPDFDFGYDDYEVICGDANREIPELINRIRRERGGHWRGAHQLAFIDNEHIDVKMRTIHKMSEMYNDLLITFQTPNIQMKVTGGKVSDLSEYDEFFGGRRHRNLSSEDEFREHYLKKLARDPVNRPVQRTVPVRGSETIRYHYDMVYAAQETDGGSPWIQFADGMERRLGGLSSEKIGQVIDQLQGESAPLSVFSDDGPGLEGFTK